MKGAVLKQQVCRVCRHTFRKVPKRPVPHATSNTLVPCPSAGRLRMKSARGTMAVRCIASCRPMNRVSVEVSYTLADFSDSHPSVCTHSHCISYTARSLEQVTCWQRSLKAFFKQTKAIASAGLVCGTTMALQNLLPALPFARDSFSSSHAAHWTDS